MLHPPSATSELLFPRAPVRTTLRHVSTALNSAVALFALGLAVLAIVLATIANRRWASRPGRTPAPTATPAPTVAAEPAAEPGPSAAQAEQLWAEQRRSDRAELEALQAALGVLRGQVEGLAARAEAPVSDPTALRHIALVRYDAFADVGGRLSYSVALLDDTRSGLVLTTLAGKSDVRTYVRTISAGAPDGSLTAEEQQAIDAAVGSGQ